MNTTHVTVGKDKHTICLSAPKIAPDPLNLTFPEFHGKVETGPFAIQEVLRLKQADPDERVRFNLEGSAGAVGIEFKGSATAADGEIRIRAQIRNLRGSAIHYGHHTLMLDTSDTKAFDDPTGERTFLYAETGWASVSQLLDPIHSHHHTMRIGASHNGITVMWKMIARLDTSRRVIMALAMDKGYAFASDHPEWGKGLMGGYRWGTITSQESKSMDAKLYLFKGTLNDLRLRYVKDFK